MARKLGVAMTEREALALLGRADAEGEGGLGYPGLVRFFLTDADRPLFQQDPRASPPVLDEDTP
jgi:hypothetical protein